MIDKLDRKLIEELQKDGRESYTELARKLGVTEGTVRKRVKNLVNKNIMKIVAVPNVSELGYKLMSIIGMQVKMVDLRKVADALAKKANVCHLAFVAGRYDLMILVVSRSHKELSDFIEKEISTIPSVLRTETFVNLDIIKGAWSGTDITQLISDLDSFLHGEERKRE
jgi:Lrp/AsnC family transcriptional regulator for asnA, asnC and gidA